MTQTIRPKFQTAVWAINPFESETKLNPTLQEELREWINKAHVEVQPIHILEVSKEDELDEGDGSWIRRYRPLVRKVVSNYIQEMKLPNVRDAQILKISSSSTNVAVDALLRYARDCGANWIICSSKGQSGFKRLAAGSFAETLIAKSPVPVWVLGQGKTQNLDTRKILIATDFSEPSRRAFEAALDQASFVQAEVILYHAITYQNAALVGSTVGLIPIPPITEYSPEHKKWARKTAMEWVNFSGSRGVPARFIVEEVSGFASDAILTAARFSGVGVIAIASQSGRLAAAVLGSTARQLIRQSPCPVWVYGPKYVEKSTSPHREEGEHRAGVQG